ncbi:hypothetical protein C7M22_00288 [Bacillus velezensis]|nr:MULTISPECIES: tyrosine-type recombinase/integrase [Bacillus amyloliquefaciens group]MCJ2173246.1 tyrosine-type recombinase/integrase [Bacillus amyloliquefaciens]MCR4356008.1 tyrosine-type recombinase/integrase [Bacillus amyloliquefaciens]QHK06151.1 hypothetical protein C7M19_01085 [Bacillus velezensis]QHK11674.1 hypothetical protein C7M20_02803 [Bacillus velezensis]QHK14543.1 hypothetical protein C7M21_01807 [Bacillus velezensis]
MILMYEAPGLGAFLFILDNRTNRELERGVLSMAAAEYVVLDNIGTHTLRKTFGYHFYRQTKDVAMLQEIFNHSDQRTTLRYIGINRYHEQRQKEIQNISRLIS